MLGRMANEGQPKRPRSPRQQLLLLAIPGALPWLVVALTSLTDWFDPGPGAIDLLGVIFILMLLAVAASIAVVTVKGHWRLKVVVALFDLSYLLAVLPPSLAR